MTADSLATDIRAAVDDDTLELTSAVLGDSGFVSLLARVVAGPALVFDDVEVVLDDDTIEVSGSVTAFSVMCTASVSITVGADEITYAVDASMPDGWSVADSYPAFAGSPIALAQASSARMSARLDGSGSVGVDATVDVPDLGLSGVRFAIESDGDAWSLSAEVASIDIAALSWLAISDATVEFSTTAGEVAGGRIGATATVDDVTVEVALTFAGWDDTWSLVGDFQSMRLEGLASLSSLVGTDAFASAMPTTLSGASDAIVVDRLAIDFSPSTKVVEAIRLGVAIPKMRELVAGKASLRNIAVDVDIAHPMDSASRVVSGTASCTIRLGDVDVDLEGTLSTSATLTGTIEVLGLNELTESFLPNVDLPDGLPSVQFADVSVDVDLDSGDFSISASSSTAWTFAVGTDGIALDDISLAVSREVAANGRRSIVGSISGTAHLGARSFTASYDFPGGFVLRGNLPPLSMSEVLQDLCGDDLVRDLGMAPSFLAIGLAAVTFEIDVAERRMSLTAETPLGTAAVSVRPDRGGRWAFAGAIVVGSDRSFASMAPELEVLDDLGISGSALVFSSSDDPGFELPTGGRQLDVGRGVSVHATLDLTGTGADAVLGIEQLAVSATIGTSLADLSLEASIGGDMVIDDGVVLTDIEFRLQPVPIPTIAVSGMIVAQLGADELRFVGGFAVQPRSAVFTGTMLGRWNDAFGFDRVVLADVAVDLGLSYPPPLPVIGIAGALEVGDFRGAAAVRFDSALPSRSMLAVTFNRLYLMDVIRTFCDAEVVMAIPPGLQNTVLDIGFEGVELYIVPQPTTIGELHFEQGFRLAGTMQFWGLRAWARLEIDASSGVFVAGEMDAIDIAGIFKLTGVDGRPNPSLMIDLRAGGSPTVDIQGAVELLGLRRETHVWISDDGFGFTTTGKIFDVFEATITATGTDLARGGDFSLTVSMRNDLFEYLRTEATQAIAAAADVATRELSAARRDLDRTRAEVDRLTSEINRMRNVVTAERRVTAERLRSAEAAVAAEQRKVNSLNSQIASMRTTIQAERRRDTDRLRAAQQDVARAQSDVNSLQTQINSAHARIRTLNNEMAAWDRWYAGLRWWDQAWGWTRLGAEKGWRAAEVGAQYTRIGSLEAARGVANGALEIAKQVVRGIEAAANTFPIDADPRIAGLYTALGVATGALQAAQAVVRGVRDLTAVFPVDADPRVAGLFVARDSANLALSAATEFLEGLEFAVGGLADVGTFIVEAGLGGLLDIRAASFAGQLSATAGGSVALSVHLDFMGAPQHLALSFNFHDPFAAVTELVERLLPA